MADDERSEEERRREEEQAMADDEENREREERLRAELAWWDPWDGPASENAYPEDPENDPDGSFKAMNDAARAYNRVMGYVDEAADIPWTPENAKSPKGSEVRFTEEDLARSRELQAEWDARIERFEKGRLRSPSELPDLTGEDLEITWDFEPDEAGEDGWTVLRHGERVIWREVGMNEALSHFDEVLWILREKYGRRLASLTPTRAGLLQLRGPGYPAGMFVEELNQELREKRGPLEPKGTIEVEDADTDKAGPERELEELKAAVREMGAIDCSCGWAGDATEARLVGTRSPVDLLCPDCRRPLFAMSLDE